MKRIRTVAAFPTMFTLANLVCGFFAIVVAAPRIEKPMTDQTPVARAVEHYNFQSLVATDDTHNCMLSGYLIFLAMIFDALDGHVARLARTTSDFGAQLDSLCDLVTFGVAPAFLLVKMCPNFTYQHSRVVWIIAASYAACAALCLARFNVESTDDDDHMTFSGLPSPAAAASIAGFAILFYELRHPDANQLTGAPQIDQIVQWILPLFALCVALLMVSRIPYPHIVNQMFRGQRSFGHIVALLFAAFAIMSIHGYSVPIILCLFVMWAPAKVLWRRLRVRREHPDPLF